GSQPLVGASTFLPKEHAGEVSTEIELIRSTPEEKGQQIDNVANFQDNRNALAEEGTARRRVNEGWAQLRSSRRRTNAISSKTTRRGSCGSRRRYALRRRVPEARLVGRASGR